MPVKQKHQPRKHSRNFLKVYAPYLPLFLVLGFGLFVSFGSNFKQPNSHVLSFASDINKSSLIKETNDERSSADLQPLTQNSSLKPRLTTWLSAIIGLMKRQMAKNLGLLLIRRVIYTTNLQRIWPMVLTPAALLWQAG